jgi:type I restriction-modification system DNA methylase subunit
MNNNKESERAELHKTIWRIANDLRRTEEADRCHRG